jgi:hypothetical protein
MHCIILQKCGIDGWVSSGKAALQGVFCSLLLLRWETRIRCQTVTMLIAIKLVYLYSSVITSVLTFTLMPCLINLAMIWMDQCCLRSITLTVRAHLVCNLGSPHDYDRPLSAVKLLVANLTHDRFVFSWKKQPARILSDKY